MSSLMSEGFLEFILLLLEVQDQNICTKYKKRIAHAPGWLCLNAVQYYLHQTNSIAREGRMPHNSATKY